MRNSYVLRGDIGSFGYLKPVWSNPDEFHGGKYGSLKSGTAKSYLGKFNYTGTLGDSKVVQQSPSSMLAVMLCDMPEKMRESVMGGRTYAAVSPS